MKIDKLEAWSLKPNQDVASVERKVLSSYGWCSHFVGEPVTYAIFKERRGVYPLDEVEQVSMSASDPLLSTPTKQALPPMRMGKE